MADRHTTPHVQTLPPRPFIVPAAIAASLFLVGVIGWMIESRAQILRAGQEAVLETQPIDPRDLLRGRYVRLNYAIGRPDTELVTAFFEALPQESFDDRFYQDQVIYVLLRLDETGFHRVSAISMDRPEDGLFIRGEADFNPTSRSLLTIDYGISRFYTNEKLAPELEARMRDGEKTTVIVAVDDLGSAQIKAFRQDGVNIVTEQLY